MENKNLTLQQQRNLVYKALTELQTTNNGVSVTPAVGHKLVLLSSDPEIKASIDLSVEFVADVRGNDWHNQFTGIKGLHNFLALITNLIK